MYFRKTESGVVVNVRVIPKASRNEVMGVVNDELRVRLMAPPVDGAANKALVEVLLKYLTSANLKVKKKDIQIIKGKTSRRKEVEIKGLEDI